MQTFSSQRLWLGSFVVGLVLVVGGCQPNGGGPDPAKPSSPQAADSEGSNQPASATDSKKLGSDPGALAGEGQKVASDSSQSPVEPPPQPAAQEKAQEPAVPPTKEPAEAETPAAGSEPEAPGFLPNDPEEREFPFQIPGEWKRLSEKEEIWIDAKEKLVAVSGRICLNRGLLEMFACPKGTKEHESIVATYPWAMYVHQALLLAGVNPGQTVQWEPEYKSAEGPKINVEVWYYDDQKKLVKKNAKEMVRLVSDGSTLNIDWVFGGSRFLTDPDGRELYAANGGELICVSNFSSAMIDLPIPSTAEAGALLFEANTEQIPPLNTPVLLVLTAKQAEANPGAGDQDSGKSEPEQVPAAGSPPASPQGDGGK